MLIKDNFLWGVATSAPQVEGAFNEDGKGLSIWDVASKEKIKDGSNTHIACDHYHRYKEDIKIMRDIGINSYRFSLSWPRIIPQEGKINDKGIKFYNDLINELIKNKIEPIVTIYHWDLPLWVNEKGGWLSKNIYKYFSDYVKVVAENFSDRVKYWCIINEPQCFIMNGYMVGAFAPFKKNPLKLNSLTKNCFKAVHEGVIVLRKYAKKKPLIGFASASGAFIPKTENLSDIKDAENKSFNYKNGKLSNAWWCDPLILGKSVRAYGFYHLSNSFVKKVKTKFDFIAINTYAPFVNNWYGKTDDPNVKSNSLNWVVDGRVLYWTTRFFANRYHLPILISENGYCDNDELIDGEVHDIKRIEFLKEYISYLDRAIEEGYDVIGYQYWSLMDNFEWAEGFKPRFGLVYIDYNDNLKRIPKDSAYFYKKIIEDNGKIASN